MSSSHAFAIRRALQQSSRWQSLPRRQVRSNSTVVGRNALSSTSTPTPTPTPSQQLYTLREIDRLTKAIAQESSSTTAHPSPLAMRSFSVPWLSSSSPDLASQTDSSAASSSSSSEPSLTAKEQTELLRPKHMSESFTSFDLPLASDPTLFERYVNASGGFRMGKLLEHLDSLAGAVAYRHCLPAPSKSDSSKPSSQQFHEASSRAGLYLATASADRLDMFGRLNRHNVRDLKFSGFVTWTGKSSMEVVVKLEGAPHPSPSFSSDIGQKPETLMLGRFAMVCRDTKTHKAKQIPPLEVESGEERILWTIGDGGLSITGGNKADGTRLHRWVEHQKRRKATALNALDKVPPSSEESKELHQLMLHVTDTIDGEEVVQMKDTEVNEIYLPDWIVIDQFEKDRIGHAHVSAKSESAWKSVWREFDAMGDELCFTNAAIFASRPMRFLSLDQITFRLPVPVGAVLRLSSKVVKTTRPDEEVDGEAKVHIMVRAEVEEVETGLRRETNTFSFTMAAEDNEPLGKVVVPSTYAEAMHYLEGKRRLAIGAEMRRLYLGNNAR